MSMSVEDYTKIFKDLETCQWAKNSIVRAKGRMNKTILVREETDELLIDIWKDSCVIQDSLERAINAIIQVCRELHERMPKDEKESSDLYNQMISIEGMGYVDDEEEDE